MFNLPRSFPQALSGLCDVLGHARRVKDGVVETTRLVVPSHCDIADTLPPSPAFSVSSSSASSLRLSASRKVSAVYADSRTEWVLDCARRSLDRAQAQRRASPPPPAQTFPERFRRRFALPSHWRFEPLRDVKTSGVEYSSQHERSEKLIQHFHAACGIHVDVPGFLSSKITGQLSSTANDETTEKLTESGLDWLMVYAVGSVRLNVPLDGQQVREVLAPDCRAQVVKLDQAMEKCPVHSYKSRLKRSQERLQQRGRIVDEGERHCECAFLWLHFLTTYGAEFVSGCSVGAYYIKKLNTTNLEASQHQYKEKDRDVAMKGSAPTPVPMVSGGGDVQVKASEEMKKGLSDADKAKMDSSKATGGNAASLVHVSIATVKWTRRR